MEDSLTADYLKRLSDEGRLAQTNLQVVARVNVAKRPSKQTRIRPGRLPWLGTVHPDSRYLILLRGLLILSGTIMLPRREWGFHFRASSLQWSYIEGPGPASEDLMRRDLALHLDAYVQANAPSLGVLLVIQTPSRRFVGVLWRGGSPGQERDDSR